MKGYLLTLPKNIYDLQKTHNPIHDDEYRPEIILQNLATLELPQQIQPPNGRHEDIVNQYNLLHHIAINQDPRYTIL